MVLRQQSRNTCAICSPYSCWNWDGYATRRARYNLTENDTMKRFGDLLTMAHRPKNQGLGRSLFWQAVLETPGAPLTFAVYACRDQSGDNMTCGAGHPFPDRRVHRFPRSGLPEACA